MRWMSEERGVSVTWTRAIIRGVGGWLPSRAPPESHAGIAEKAIECTCRWWTRTNRGEVRLVGSGALSGDVAISRNGLKADQYGPHIRGIDWQ